MTIYAEWGFDGSPFQTTSLPPSALGEKLLVGRDKQTATLMRRIGTGPKLATVEGLNGVGKTSIVNVAAYKLFNEHLKNGSGPLLVPCRKIFQLKPTEDIQNFIDYVLLEVAQTLIEQGARIRDSRETILSAPVDRWLSQPHPISYSGGAWIIQGSHGETNTPAEVNPCNLRKAVITWLEQIFSDDGNSGVICTIDNLELLQSSEAARVMLEQLRDELLTLPGIRWVLCGSLGIVHGVVSSPRLEGYLHPPIELDEVGSDQAAQILDSRLGAYSHEALTPYLPLTVNGFEQLYSVLRGNLRSVLSYADNYCQWIADNGSPDNDPEKDSSFLKWLNIQARANHDAVRQQLRPRPMEVYKIASELQIFSPSDYEIFGFNSIQAMRTHIRDLEDAGLLVSTQDEGDRRRKTIQMTSKGWLVRYFLDTVDRN